MLASAQMFFNTLCLIYEHSRKNSFQTKIIPLHHLESPEGHLHQKLFYTLKKQTAKKENQHINRQARKKLVAMSVNPG